MECDKDLMFICCVVYFYCRGHTRVM